MFFKNLFSNKGVLGINARNLLYIKPYNPKKAIKLADDKIKTKQFLSARGIPVPKLYSIIKTTEELAKFDFNNLPSKFAIKPNKGFGGEGIIIITDKEKDEWIGANSKHYIKEDFVDHIRDILDGRFSISNVGDFAFFEQFIAADERIGKYSYEGLPDIRVVVHNLIPVMAMLRLPTKESEGKANIHQGACAAGIDIAKGETTFLTYRGKITEELPDGLGKIRGLKIPYWDDILLIASKAQLITNLGYLAADICIDKNSGPVLLEINARAGLQVQVANLAPLHRRLERIEGLKVPTPEKGVRIAKEMFGNTVEKEIINISGKQIISTEEEIEIIRKKGPFRIKAKVDTTKLRSIIDEKIAQDWGLLENTENYDDEKSTLKIKFSLKNKRISTIADVEKINKNYKFIIGERDLKDFLIQSNPTKENKQLKPTTKEEKDSNYSVSNYREIDQSIVSIENKIKLLYHLRPVNLQAEKIKFFKDPQKNPIFEYPKLKFDSLELESELNKLKTDETPLGKLFAKKKTEISNKIALLEAIDEERFTDISIRLFGHPTKEEIQECLKMLKKTKVENSISILSAKDAKERFEKTFAHYGLKNWKVIIKNNLVADCVAGKNNNLFLKADAKFTNEKIEALIIHEIETHILTAENGKFQPYEIFNIGFPNYLLTQEGLAIYNVEKQRHIPFYNRKKLIYLMIGLEKALKSSFVEIFDVLKKLDATDEQAFRVALKVKRGFSDTSKPGAFTKDLLYFRGYKQIKKFIEDGGNLRDLYLGKFNLEDLETVKKISGIQEPRILPDWLK